MKTGQVLHRFTANDGREVILRTPKWEDLDDFLDYINSLAKEDLAVLPKRRILTRNEEAVWLERRIAQVEKGDVIDIVAEIDRKVIANSEVTRRRKDASHVGEVGISVLSDYRNLSIGTEMMKLLLYESKKAGLKVLVLSLYGDNKHARHIYEKLGFKETGRIPSGFYRKNRYVDEIIMTLIL